MPFFSFILRLVVKKKTQKKKKGPPTPLQLETLIGTSPYSRQETAQPSAKSNISLLDPLWIYVLPSFFLFVLSDYVSNIGVRLCVF